MRTAPLALTCLALPALACSGAGPHHMQTLDPLSIGTESSLRGLCAVDRDVAGTCQSNGDRALTHVDDVAWQMGEGSICGLGQIAAAVHQELRQIVVAAHELRIRLERPPPELLLAVDLAPGADQPAEIVRHAIERRDRADGVGLRFVHFAADGERRLVAFLERHLG